MCLDAIFEIQDDEKFYWKLVERALYFFNLEGDEGNTIGERVIADIYAVRFETNGGGAHSYLFNSSGDMAFRLSDSLRAIGAPELADSFGKLSKLFPSQTISKSQKERWEQMETLGDRLEGLCEKFNEEFFATEDNNELNLVNLSVVYARKNREHFER